MESHQGKKKRFFSLAKVGSAESEMFAIGRGGML